jgi:hypothetical protein
MQSSKSDALLSDLHRRECSMMTYHQQVGTKPLVDLDKLANIKTDPVVIRRFTHIGKF